MSKRDIHVDTKDLRLGMYVSNLDRPWLDTPFLLQGFLLDDEQDLRTLQRLCQFVEVDPVRSTVALAAPKSDLAPPNVELTVYVEEAPVEQELPRAQETYGRTEKILEGLVEDVQAGSHLHIEQVDDAVEDMVQSVVANPDALMWIARLRKEQSKTYVHGIRVSVYLLALGRHLGFPLAELHHLGMIGLLLDLGKTRLPPELLEKKGKLAPEEFEQIKRHVEFGLEMLRDSPNLSPSVLEGIAQHHERLNGRGYPKGLKGDEIGIFGRMAGIADSFAALTSPRPYMEAMSPSDALGSLYESAGEYFHGPLIERFVQAIGAFPVGSLVELSTGEVAVVIRHNRVRRLQPTVLLLTDAGKKPLERPTQLDLLYQQSAGEEKPIRIRCGLPLDAYGVDTSAYFLSATPLAEASTGDGD